MDENVYNIKELCDELGVTLWTVRNWYGWEKKLLAENKDMKKYLPEPINLVNLKGKPRVWTKEMVDELKEYKKSIIVGRNGAYGKYSNPNHKNTKKYKENENDETRKISK